MAHRTRKAKLWAARETRKARAAKARERAKIMASEWEEDWNDTDFSAPSANTAGRANGSC